MSGNLHSQAVSGAMKGKPFGRPMKGAVADALGDLYGLRGQSVVDTKTVKRPLFVFLAHLDARCVSQGRVVHEAGAREEGLLPHAGSAGPAYCRDPGEQDRQATRRRVRLRHRRGQREDALSREPHAV